MSNEERLEINDRWKFKTQLEIDMNGKLLGIDTYIEARKKSKAIEYGSADMYWINAGEVFVNYFYERKVGDFGISRQDLYDYIKIVDNIVQNKEGSKEYRYFATTRDDIDSFVRDNSDYFDEFYNRFYLSKNIDDKYFNCVMDNQDPIVVEAFKEARKELQKSDVEKKQ